MAAQKTANNVNDVLATLENVIRADTEATVGDLDLLNRINLHATERYKAIADAAVGLETDSEYLGQKYAEIEKYKQQVDNLEERVGDLEAIAKELEEWTGELEIKVRRLSRRN
ncbi:hypothetical protein L873DRAFT_806290 [Choiromyces venosus 120613-1]|uniref:Biogenesis of lysosome-related organelles complex 1 subunit 2 n=1 Tax=Choiromyces venosus 120613-1 TaxID=1336337 RepID=A0A3N4KI61_9PEZI|nr:hypothetical protein L873DRAFT_806290 [Choiromyces venosus 120613-1]